MKELYTYFKEHIVPILVIAQTAIFIYIATGTNIFYSSNKPAVQQQRNMQQQAPRPQIDLDDLKSGAAYRGAENPKVTIVMFNSFSCGYCRKAKDAMDQVMQKYPDTVQLVYKHFNRGPVDVEAAMAVECAGEQSRDKFWQMYSNIFDNGLKKDFSGYARNAGLNTGQFQECMRSRKYQEKTMLDSRTGQQLGIRGTPSFIVNDEMVVGYRPAEAFFQLIESKL